jgi:hypothetical protein
MNEYGGSLRLCTYTHSPHVRTCPRALKNGRLRSIFSREFFVVIFIFVSVISYRVFALSLDFQISRFHAA